MSSTKVISQEASLIKRIKNPVDDSIGENACLVSHASLITDALSLNVASLDMEHTSEG